MKWTATILAAVILMVVFSTGVALAVSLTGTDRSDILHRADRTEQISGLGGEDQLQGGDLVKGGLGSDELGRGGVYGGGGVDNLIGYGGDASLGRFYGGAGNDTVQSRDVPAVKDTVNCGSSTDTVSADKVDIISDVCESVKAW